MKRLLLAFALLAPFLRAAEIIHVDDPAQLLPRESARSGAEKLAVFERETGVRVLLRCHAQSPSAEEDEVPGAFMRALARRLGIAERGVLVVYFADDPDWRLWIGDGLAVSFSGQEGSVAELTANKAIHDAKEALLAAAKAQADAAVPEAKSPAHLAAETDALLTGLLRRLKPAR